MKQQEAMQYVADGVGVLAGVGLDFEQPPELPCGECGAMVGMTSVITVNVIEADGSQSTQEMTEANARALVATVGLPLPPVLCYQHARITIGQLP